MNFWYLNTGSGNGGKNFNYSGIFFLYDFPLMHKEFKDNGGEWDVINTNYDKYLSEYYKEFQVLRTNTINENPDMKYLNSFEKQISEISSKLHKAKALKEKELLNEFNRKYNKKPELPNSAFYKNNNRVMEIFCDLDFSDAIFHPEIKSIGEMIDTKGKEINNFIKNNAEFFV